MDSVTQPLTNQKRNRAKFQLQCRKTIWAKTNCIRKRLPLSLLQLVLNLTGYPVFEKSTETRPRKHLAIMKIYFLSSMKFRSANEILISTFKSAFQGKVAVKKELKMSKHLEEKDSNSHRFFKRPHIDRGIGLLMTRKVC